jgi:hypothetical protein
MPDRLFEELTNPSLVELLDTKFDKTKLQITVRDIDQASDTLPASELAISTAISAATNSGELIDITKAYTSLDLVTWEVAPGGPFITGLPQNLTLNSGDDVILRPLADILANTLSDPLSVADLLLFKYVGKNKIKTETWELHGTADGTIQESGKVLKAELITLPDATGVIPPLAWQTMEVSTEGGVSFTDWGTAGGLFQTENGGAGTTTLPAVATITGDRNSMKVQYNAGSDAWIFLI